MPYKDPIKNLECKKRWAINNPSKNKQSYLKSKQKKLLKEPWYRLFQSASTRCYSKKNNYYKRGIKMFLSPEDLKMMWFRDKAYMMEHPSIDRIDSSGDYTLQNTRIIEYKENLRLAAKNRQLNLLGMRFGKLNVIEYVGLKKNSTQHYTYWKCLCDCGKIKEVRGVYLKRNVTRSCGCLKWGNK